MMFIFRAKSILAEKVLFLIPSRQVTNEQQQVWTKPKHDPKQAREKTTPRRGSMSSMSVVFPSLNGRLVTSCTFFKQEAQNGFGTAAAAALWESTSAGDCCAKMGRKYHGRVSKQTMRMANLLVRRHPVELDDAQDVRTEEGLHVLRHGLAMGVDQPALQPRDLFPQVGHLYHLLVARRTQEMHPQDRSEIARNHFHREAPHPHVLQKRHTHSHYFPRTHAAHTRNNHQRMTTYLRK